MGGKAIRSEASELVVSEAAQEILERAGWLTYFSRLRESNETVAMEFLQNLQEEHSVVGGKQIMVTKEIIAEVTGLLWSTWKVCFLTSNLVVFQYYF